MSMRRPPAGTYGLAHILAPDGDNSLLLISVSAPQQRVSGLRPGDRVVEVNSVRDRAAAAADDVISNSLNHDYSDSGLILNEMVDLLRSTSICSLRFVRFPPTFTVFLKKNNGGDILGFRIGTVLETVYERDRK